MPGVPAPIKDLIRRPHWQMHCGRRTDPASSSANLVHTLCCKCRDIVTSCTAG
ncbi:hypothetical protein BDA96_10G216400 [Sorghum bicolor]|uniref:Uncharacterized protein n=1 Tax=Sorghum bicolor TaxID=4558 RepID=A0A921U1P0_SORBI|nr:hypothetical protein BDA96_10G216400 [Sorghum bicolor]